MINDLLVSDKFVELENFVEEDLQDEIEKTVLSPLFNWNFSYSTGNNFYMLPEDYNTQNLYKHNIVDYFMFVHTLIGKRKINSPYINLLNKLMDCFYKKTNFKKTDILRAKINFLTPYNNQKDNCMNMPHMDMTTPHYVLIYYVNNSDGDTLFFNKNLDITHRITPVKGKFLLFDGSLLHTGVNPKTFNNRVLINIDLAK